MDSGNEKPKTGARLLLPETSQDLEELGRNVRETTQKDSAERWAAMATFPVERIPDVVKSMRVSTLQLSDIRGK